MFRVYRHCSFLMLVALALPLQAGTHTITSAGFSFSPATITIIQGDNVQFSLDAIHNAVEVTRATWDANSNTPDGGFAVPFGGGTVTFTTVDTLYYVCQVHAAMGMKGIIIVAPPVSMGGIPPLQPSASPDPARDLSIDEAYPNPVSHAQGGITLRIRAARSGLATVAVYDELGRCVRQAFSGELRSDPLMHVRVDLAGLPAGIYSVQLSMGSEAVQKMVAIRQ
jgi:plastocyanin